MKITINKVLLFLQAILLLAGFPVVGMHNAFKNDLKSNAVFNMVKEFQLSSAATTLWKQDNKVRVENNIPKSPEHDATLDDNPEGEAETNKSIIVLQNDNVELQGLYDSLSALEIKKNTLVSHLNEATPGNISKLQKKINELDSEIKFIEQRIRLIEGNNRQPVLLIRSGIPLPPTMPRLNGNSKSNSFNADAFKKEIEQKADQIEKKKRFKANVEYAKTIPAKAVDKAYQAASYVAQTPVVQNPLVGTVVSLGKTLFNAAGSWLTSTEDYVRQSVDLVDVNVEYNVFKNLNNAIDEFNSLPENNLGNHVLNNKDIVSTYTSREQKVRAMGTVLELIKPQGTINNTQVQDDIKAEQALYAPIKKALEEILSQSYAQISHNHTLVDALRGLQSKTEKAIDEKITVFKNAIEKYFDNLKSEALKIEAKSKEEQSAIEQKMQHYDNIKTALDKAAQLYKQVFLIDNVFTNLLKIESQYIDTAIGIYTDYVAWLKKYKKCVEALKQSDFQKTKEYVNKNQEVDFIIELHKKDKRSDCDIWALCEKQKILLENYKSLYNIVSIIVGYNNLDSWALKFKDLQNHLNAFIESDDFCLFTQSQQESIQSIVSDFEKECEILDKALYFADRFSTFQSVSFCIDTYNNMEKVFKKYQEPEFKDIFEDVSIDELTVNRSQGIEKLVEKHGSVSAFIKLAEKEQAAYAERQEKRFNILNASIKTQIDDLLISICNNDKQPTDEDLNKFDSFAQSIIQASDLNDEHMVYTTPHKKQLITIVEHACQDAKNSIKVAIIAGWTVLGVEAKLAFEKLANTKGSDAKAVVKRGFGKALNAMRKGFIGAGNKIAEKEYHKETRKKIKEAVIKKEKSTKELGLKAVDFIKKESRDRARTSMDSLLERVDTICEQAEESVNGVFEKLKQSWNNNKSGREALLIEARNQINNIIFVEVPNQLGGIIFGVPSRVISAYDAVSSQWDDGFEARQAFVSNMEQKLNAIKGNISGAFDNLVESLKQNGESAESSISTFKKVKSLIDNAVEKVKAVVFGHCENKDGGEGTEMKVISDNQVSDDEFESLEDVFHSDLNNEDSDLE